MPLAFLTFQLLAPNGYQRRQTVKAQKGHDTAAFPRCGAFAIPTNAPRRWRCATRFETHCATTKCSPYPTDGQVGRGGFPTVVAVPLRRPREPRASGYLFLASRIRRELRPELFCGKRWLLAIVEPIGKQHERLTICDHGPAMQAGRARCTKAASGRAYDTIVAIRGWRPEDWSSGPGRRRAAQGLCGRSTNGAR